MIHQLFLLLNALGSEWVLIVLGILSLSAVAIVAQQYRAIQSLSHSSQRLWEDHLQEWFNSGGTCAPTSSLAALRVEYPSLESEVLSILAHTDIATTADERERVAQAYLNSRKLTLERRLGVLGTIGANAPFIGLLGTVLGIIRAFHQISLNGMQSGMDGIAGGIAEALVATAIGLVVAVPSVALFNLFNRRISTLLSRAQTVATFVIARRAQEKTNDSF